MSTPRKNERPKVIFVVRKRDFLTTKTILVSTKIILGRTKTIFLTTRATLGRTKIVSVTTKSIFLTTKIVPVVTKMILGGTKTAFVTTKVLVRRTKITAEGGKTRIRQSNGISGHAHGSAGLKQETGVTTPAGGLITTQDLVTTRGWTGRKAGFNFAANGSEKPLYYR